MTPLRLIFPWNTFRLRTKLALAFGALLSLLFGVGSWMAYSHQNSVQTVNQLLTVDNHLVKLCAKSSTAMLGARQAEKDFLLRTRELSFDEAGDKYVSLFRMQVASIQDHLAVLQVRMNGPTELRKVESLVQIVETFEKEFLQTAALFRRRGNQTEGLEGQFRRTLEEIDLLLQQPGLDALQLRFTALRRLAIPFLITKLGKNTQQFRKALESFQSDIQSAAFPGEPNEALTVLAAELGSQFQLLKDVDDLINQHSEKYRRAAYAAEPGLEDLQAHAVAEQSGHIAGLLNDTGAALTLTLLMTVSVFLLGGIVIFLLSRSIEGDVRRCVNFADELAAGRLETRLKRSGCDEFARLAQSLNFMGNTLREGRLLLETRVWERTTELAEANQELQGEMAAREETQRHLLVAKEAAEQANCAKSEFLANMSHEIRTPMNGILGMTELLLDSDLSHDQKDHMTMVKSSADALLAVINDILDFSKIETGKFDLDPVDVNLREDLGDALKLLALRAHKKGLELTYHVPPDVPNFVVADSLRLRQIIINLVGNAIKFTERGEVVVRVNKTADTEEGDLLHFSVSDSGIGIAKDKLAEIFNPFTQGDGSTTRKYGGTGLGLTISARLVEMMGGTIWVESEQESGTTFHFTSRVGKARGMKTIPIHHVNLENLPVLVVDDNSTNRVILSEVLLNWHMRPTPVDNGPRAVREMKKACAAGSPFPLVLLDALMPEMDGFAVAEEIKKDPLLAGATILMLSSVDSDSDARRCKEVGIARYLRKPIKQSELFDAILAALGSVPLEPCMQPRSSEERSVDSGWKILLAEDNVVNQHLAKRILSKRGHDVEVVTNGIEALAALERDCFDLVLMDVQMPEMDGFAATIAIRAGEKETGKHIPIIALTAHAMKGDRERCLAAGMDAYVAKPLRPQELLAVMERLLREAPVPALAGCLGVGL